MATPEQYASARWCRRERPQSCSPKVQAQSPGRGWKMPLWQAAVWVAVGWFQAQASGDPADLQSVSEQRVVVPLLTVPLTACLGVAA